MKEYTDEELIREAPKLLAEVKRLREVNKAAITLLDYYMMEYRRLTGESK